jgi:hypothetical protein
MRAEPVEKSAAYCSTRLAAQVLTFEPAPARQPMEAVIA